MNNQLPSLYQQYIHLSRYSKWLPDKKRRETWPETVARYFDFFHGHLEANHNFVMSKELRQELENAVLNLEVLPSMRCLMTAGKALEKENIAGYNCSYVPIDDPRAFDESLYILMNGTGLGFSVERQYINKLPEVPEELHPTETIIVVADSKLGWAKALKELISLLYSGLIPGWNLDKVRPAGTPLKTFGGRASGPEPLDRLFKFAVNLFQNAKGRKLTSVECHDLVCKIAEIVVVGGVRRSALISLSNLSDDRMRVAKSGQWWEINPQRALANNSAVYTETPDMGIFMKEWMSLYESKSGERGIVSRTASQKQAAKNERRKWEKVEFGTNPCLTGDTLVLTTNGQSSITSLVDNPFVALVDGKSYPSKGFWSTGIKSIYKVTLDNGMFIKGTDNHKLKTTSGWKEINSLTLRDEVVLNDTKPYWSNTKGTFEEGYLVGHIIGDGTFDPNGTPICAIWLPNECNIQEYGPTKILNSLFNKLKTRSDFKGFRTARVDENYIKYTAQCTALTDITSKFNLFKLKKKVYETGSKEFTKGMIQAYFDTDGSVQGSQNKGVSIRLSSIDSDNLLAIQRLLLNFNIVSKIYFNRKPEGQTLLPNGYGDSDYYNTKALHELIISNESIITFNKEIGFADQFKQEKLNEVISAYKRRPNKSKFFSVVKSIEYLGEEEVYDCTVEDIHCFSANGIIAHNCSEIILRPNQFCNLTEIVVRETDTFDSLKRKARLATILGTFQATLVNFRYLRKRWSDNTAEERLLGVSLTGIFDNPILNGRSQDFQNKGFKDHYSLGSILQYLKQECIDVNKELAEKLGIPQSAAITCVKPSGTISQLVNSASGIHTRHSPYYIRTIRADIKDPLAQFMKDKGFPCEPDVMNPKNVLVFSFPVKSAQDAVFRTDISAVQHLEIWLTYQDNWCEHKPSITVSVKENEWLDVAAWVYKHFDKMSGISFLPMSDHIYQQAPYQECTEEYYLTELNKMPTNIDWKELSKYEKTDETIGSQELACSAGGCEIL